MNIIPIFAAISGNTLLSMFVQIVVAGLIFWLLLWFIGWAGVPEPFNKILKIVIGLIAVIILINALLTLSGNPFIRF